MKGMWLVCAAFASAVGCGGRQILLEPPDDGGAGTGGQGLTAPVDLTQAPSQIPMACSVGGAIVNVAFDNPCLVGHTLFGHDPSEAGAHAIECTLAAAGHPVAWSFVLSLPTTDNPVTFFSNVSPNSGVQIAGLQAHVTKAEGTLTFSRVDPSNRAFIARFTGTLTWTTDPSPTTFTCTVDAPLWGAPGGFT
jgi:hypothetical protein